MRSYEDRLLFSATDLVNFLGCRHATFLDLRQLSEPAEVPPVDEMLKLLAEKGLEHERAHLAALRTKSPSVVEVNSGLPLDRRVALTREAMRGGVHVIYQGALFAPPWHGYSDFLTRVEEPSGLGSWSYEVVDTKLARSVKPKYAVQLSVYSALVGIEQGRLPKAMHVVLGDTTTETLHLNDFFYYLEFARERFEAYCRTPPSTSAGEPCGHCAVCQWIGLCEEEWERADHLSLVANIRGIQIAKLWEAGVKTMAELAALPKGSRIPNLNSDSFERLRTQAFLQIEKRRTGENRYEILPRTPGKGFDRLPKPDDGDLFFDMEGDPLYGQSGLEYLFGFAHREPDRSVRFTPFWAHNETEEKIAFERAMDFIMARLKQYPNAYIYHYATYEETALKRLAMIHGTREAEVDDLLRRRKLVDLYKIVKDAVRVSEPSYSIKNLEAFYAEKRAGDVTTASDSIVVYEQWRRLQKSELLKSIADYNEVDCRSTRHCRDWLLSLRPTDAVWFTGPVAEIAEANEGEREAKRLEAEERMRAITARLIDDVAETDRPWRELLVHLLEFHRREAKPSWWAMFSRLDMTDEELVDDGECLGRLSRDGDTPPYRDKRSTVHTYGFPPQDYKMGVGDTPLRADNGKPAGEIVALEDDAGTISLKLGPSKTATDKLSLIPQGPLGDKVLRDAIYRYAESVASGRAHDYAALTSLLKRELPRLKGRDAGQPIVPADANPTVGTIDALRALDRSYLLVQGPPGTGKTFTSATAIVELLRDPKCRIGVSALSHKAINNLLKWIEKIAMEKGVRFRGIKKSSNEDQYLNGGGMIEDTEDNDEACHGGHQLIAGTAWLFAREDLDQALDCLFIDEAGQVSLGHMVASALCAKNIVLVGDQMQLSQPIQGTHPGSSGLSALEYLLEDLATIPPERGIFLPTTRRMNTDVCRFISKAVYDGRLHPEETVADQRLALRSDADPALRASGISFVDVEHVGCEQKCPEEAERVRALFDSLLRQGWTDSNGITRSMTTDDVLVVSPYNMQVNLLKSVLPAGARVGTVDKFQGQEGAVVLISMTTSSGEDIPRNIEFLFSRNRLNVAISRARCLAVIVASPHLLEVQCNRIAQMRLVNTLCWAKAYAVGLAPPLHKLEAVEAD